MPTSQPLWTWDAVVAAAEGKVAGIAPAVISGVSIDTRSIQAGDLFVALKDVRDGHEFVSTAFKGGAVAALVSRNYQAQPSDGALIHVDDPLRALERIGIAARKRLAPSAKVIALTGSAGKTGTKEMLRACLAPFGSTHAPEKSFNNHWGVPLTLARMPADSVYAVLEIGMNHSGEITPLSQMVAAHIAIITNILPVHIGHFADGEIGIANAKAEIFAGLSPGGIAILPRDNTHYDLLARKAVAAGLAVRSFGLLPDAGTRATAIEPRDPGTQITLADPSISFALGAPGDHLAQNSLAVVAVLDCLGLPLPVALTPLAAIAAPAGRGARSIIETATGPLLLIDESYNANPASMRAALATLGTVPREKFLRRIAVLGDMRELGAEAPALHRALKPAIDGASTDLVFACGEHMRELCMLLPPAMLGGWAGTSTDLVPLLSVALRGGDVVMIKGSLGTNMAPLVTATRARSGA
jgi:UDP-N-acetylmuramoyl-tripeptide--D-alanyl-D-alanine ligase